MSDFDNLPPDYSVGQSIDPVPYVPGVGPAGTGAAQQGFAVDDESTRKASAWSDGAGKLIDLVGGEDNPLTAAIGATMSLPGDVLKTKDSIDAIRDGHVNSCWGSDAPGADSQPASDNDERAAVVAPIPQLARIHLPGDPDR